MRAHGEMKSRWGARPWQGRLVVQPSARHAFSMRAALFWLCGVMVACGGCASKEPQPNGTVPSTSASASSDGFTGAPGYVGGDPRVEVMFELQLAQAWALHATEEWLYVVGGLGTRTGVGVHRMRKAVGIPREEPERIGPWSGSTGIHSDARHLYWLDRFSIYRVDRHDLELEEIERDLSHLNPEAAEELRQSLPPHTQAKSLRKIELGGEYLRLIGDEDSVIAIWDQCLRVAIVDKATLGVRVIEPVQLFVPGSDSSVGFKTSGGGPYGTASDGRRFYCWGHVMKPGVEWSLDLSQTEHTTVLHVIDKASGEVTHVPLDFPETYVGGPLFFDNGRLYARHATLGILNPETGSFTSLGVEAELQELKDPSTGFFYWARNLGEIGRYDPATNQSSIVIGDYPELPPLHSRIKPLGGGLTLDATHLYWVESQGQLWLGFNPDDTLITAEQSGAIVRMRKP